MTFPQEIKSAGERLRDIRMSLGWDQRRMALALEVDHTYLSQLETGKKSPRTMSHYIDKARRIIEFEKSKSVKSGGHIPMETEEGISEKCHAYLERILRNCRGDQHRLSWVLIELENHFPLRGDIGTKGPKIGGPSDKLSHKEDIDADPVEDALRKAEELAYEAAKKHFPLPDTDAASRQ